MERAMVGRFMGKMVKIKTLKECLEENWRPLLGHIPNFHVLAYKWLCFIVKEK